MHILRNFVKFLCMCILVLIVNNLYAKENVDIRGDFYFQVDNNSFYNSQNLTVSNNLLQLQLISQSETQGLSDNNIAKFFTKFLDDIKVKEEQVELEKESGNESTKILSNEQVYKGIATSLQANRDKGGSDTVFLNNIINSDNIIFSNIAKMVVEARKQGYSDEEIVSYFINLYSQNNNINEYTAISVVEDKVLINKNTHILFKIKEDFLSLPVRFIEDVKNLKDFDFSEFFIILTIGLVILLLWVVIEWVLFKLVVLKKLKQFKSFLNVDFKTSIFRYVLSIFIALLVAFLVVIIPYLLIIGILINYDNYYNLLFYSLSWLACLYFFIRFIALLIKIFKYEDSFKIERFLLLFAWVISLFLLLGNILYNNLHNQFLLKSNLAIFIFLIFLILSFIKSNFYKLLKEINIMRKSFFVRHFFSILFLFFIVMELLVLALNYDLSKYLTTSIFLMVVAIIIICIFSKFLKIIIFDKFIPQVKYNFFEIYKEYDSSLVRYKSIDLFNFLRFFKHIYIVLAFIFTIFLINKLWDINLFDSNIYQYISQKWYIRILESVAIAIGILYIITCIILWFCNKRIIKLILRKQYIRVNKTLTLIELLNVPYKIIMLIILLISIIVALNISLKALLASTGAISIFVAFGAKDVIQNIFSGIKNLLEDSFFLNDTVTVSGITGVVERISLTYIGIRNGDGNLVFIPFSQVSTIINMSRDYSYAKFDIIVNYSQDVDQIKATVLNLSKALKEDEDIAKLVLNDIEFISATNNNMDYNLQLTFRIKTVASKSSTVRTYILQVLQKEFKNENIVLPNTTYHIVNESGN